MMSLRRWLRLRAARRERIARGIARRERQRQSLAKADFDFWFARAWHAYDQMQSGHEKRQVLFALSFGKHEAERFKHLTECIERFNALTTENAR